MTINSKINNRRVLGRGLGALLPDADDKNINSFSKEYCFCDLNDLIPNSKQPRKKFEETELYSLAESIKENGLLQPIIVRKKGNTYEIIAGERRWRAARIANLDKVPVVIKELSDRATFQAALVENIQRENLNCIEEALAYKSLIEEYGMTQDDISKKIGKDRSTIANYLRVLRLPQEIKESLKNNVITMGHAKLLCSIDDDKTKLELYKKIKKENMSVRAFENYLNKKPSNKKSINKNDKIFSPLEDSLREKYQTKISIKGKYTKGKIVIEFFNKNDLDRLISMLV